MLQNAAMLFVSPRARVVPLPEVFTQQMLILERVVPARNLIAIAVSVALLALFALLLRRSILGIALRAAADKFVMTRLLGVPANLVIGTAFAVSGLLAGVVALFWFGRTGSVTPEIGLWPLLVAFVSTVIGGMRSLLGAVVGGYVLALIQMAFSTFLPPALLEFRVAFVFTLVIAILLFRPEGLIRGR
jgi:branched-chain amino acid transport system permease protein